MRKMNAMQQRNSNKIAKGGKMASFASRASEETKRKFKAPAYGMKKNE